MFGTLSKKLSEVFRNLTGQALTKSNVASASDGVLAALIEADVNVVVARKFVDEVGAKALGTKLIAKVTPAQQFAKIVYDELARLLGATSEELADGARANLAKTLPRLDWRGSPAAWLICGLQGSGKTTFCAKLAAFVHRQHQKKVLLVACDLQRPMAVRQLQILGKSIDVEVFTIEGEIDPCALARRALAFAAQKGYQIAIFDTAGRLELDDALMQELESMKRALHPSEVLFVASATVGQSIAQVARAFHERIGLTGSAITMLDSDARGGAVVSIRALTQCPIKFESIGEKVEDLQPFHPMSMTDRLLGMGDTINLVRRAQQHISETEAKKLEEKLATSSFTYGDFLAQMQGIKKMGSMANMLKMLPGMSQLEISDRAFTQMEAMILSMTLRERKELDDLSINRRRRVAAGSGAQLDDVHKLVKNFQRAKQFFKNMPTNFKQMQKMMGGTPWR